MTSLADLYDVEGDDVIMRVHAQPGAGKSAVTGIHGTALKVKVAAPPVDGRANTALGELLAQTLGVPGSQVELVSGAASRSKRFRLHDVTPELVDAALEKVLAGPGGKGAPPRR